MTPKYYLNTIFQEAIADLTKLNVKFESSSSILLFLFTLPHLIFNHLTWTIYQTRLGASEEENRPKLKSILSLGKLEGKSNLYSLR